jgi:hypothetical protein
MRIIQSGGTRRNRRRVEAAGGEFEHRLNLLPRYMKLLDDFLDARTCLKIFKNRSHGHPSVRNTHAPLRLPGMLSTAGHWDQSSVGIFLPSLHRSWLRRRLPRFGGVTH